MSITREYAAYTTSLSYDDIPDDVIEYAKHLILDTIGLSVGSGPRAESTDSFFDAVADLDGSGSGGTVLTTGKEASPAYAALLNAAMAHSLDYDDTHRAGSLHPGAPVIGSALTVAEEVDASGKEFLTAVVAGYEVTCRLGMAVNPASSYGRGFHITATCGVFGGTAAAAKLYGHDTEQVAAAMGVNGSQSAGSLQFLENGSWNKRFHPGWAAHAALSATALAANGFFAASEPIDGESGFLQAYSDDPHPEKATAGLGETYELAKTGIKPYPVCRYMHGPLDALFEIVAAHDIAPGTIESVTVHIPSAGYDLIGDPTNEYPQSVVDAQFSMPFGAALALVKQDDSVDAFLDSVRGGVDDDLRRVIDRTTVETAEYIEEAYPDQWISAVSVTADGERYELTSEYPRGEPENPLSWGAVVEKFDDLVVPVAGESTARTVRGVIEELESHEISDLIEPFTASRRMDVASEDD